MAPRGEPIRGRDTFDPRHELHTDTDKERWELVIELTGCRVSAIAVPSTWAARELSAQHGHFVRHAMEVGNRMTYRRVEFHCELRADGGGQFHVARIRAPFGKPAGQVASALKAEAFGNQAIANALWAASFTLGQIVDALKNTLGLGFDAIVGLLDGLADYWDIFTAFFG